MVDVPEFPRPLAFVLSGGGATGSGQVGHLLVLRELGIVPDAIVGTSVGAINGAVVAADPAGGADRLFDIWADVRREDVFPVPPLHVLGSLRRGTAGVLPVRGLVSLITGNLGVSLLEELAIPLHVIATDAVSGGLVDLVEGRIIDALLASSAIPGRFAPRLVDGRMLLDGGLVANVPVQHAFDLGMRSAIVLDAAWPCKVTRPPQTVIESIAVALRLLTRSQADAHMTAASRRGLVVHLPSPCSVRRSPLDFEGVVEEVEATVELTQEFFEDRVGLPWPTVGAVGRPHRHPVGYTFGVATVPPAPAEVGQPVPP